MGLIQFVKDNNVEAIREIIEDDSDQVVRVGKILQNDSCGWTSLHHASHLGRLDILKLLLSTMSRRDALEAVSRTTWSLETCLLVACSSQTVNIDVVHYLLALGADVNARDENGFTPVLTACQKKGKLDMVKLLATMGADLLKVSSHCYSPLDFAISIKDADLVNYLLKYYEKKKGSNVTFYSYAFALHNMPEIVPSVIKLMGSAGIRKFLCKPSSTRMCRFFNHVVLLAKMQMDDYETSLDSGEIDQFVMANFGVDILRTFATHPDQFFMFYADFLTILPSRSPVPLESYSQPVDAFGKQFCMAVSESQVRVDTQCDPSEHLCEDGLLKYFPEVDIRPKFSLHAQARHAFRCGLNQKYSCWSAYNWLKNDFFFPGLKKYLLYEDKHTNEKNCMV